MELVARARRRAAAGRDRAGADRRRGAGAARGEGVRRLARSRADCGFVLDHASPIGEVIVATPTQQRILADFTGVEAHAGIRPEDGQQRDRRRRGGDRADGAGAARRGDDRQRRRDRRAAPRQRRPRALPDRSRGAQPRRRAGGGGRPARWPRPAPGAASEHGCDVDVDGSRSCSAATGCRRTRGAGARRGAALRGAGLEPQRVATGGGSDANALLAAGFDCVLLANGTDGQPHPEESVAGRGPRRDARGLRGDRRRGGREREASAEAAPRASSSARIR